MYSCRLLNSFIVGLNVIGSDIVTLDFDSLEYIIRVTLLKTSRQPLRRDITVLFKNFYLLKCYTQA